MKNVIFAMTLIAIAFSSCQKQAGLLAVNESTTTSELTNEFTHYYHGQIVTHQDQIPSYMSEQGATFLTNVLSGQPECYYFDSKDEELEFLKSHQALNAAYKKALEAKDCFEYAINSGEAAMYKLSGNISQEYLTYCDKYKTRAYYTLCADLYGGGGNVFVPGGGLPTLPGSLDNNSESFKGSFNNGRLYSEPLYAGSSLGIFMDWSHPPTYWSNLPIAWRNRASSAR